MNKEREKANSGVVGKPLKSARRSPGFIRPYVQSAIMCEKILHEQDGVLSAIRLVDVFFTAESNKRSSTGKPVAPVSALFTLRGGPGTVQASVVLRTPGAIKTPPVMTVDLKGGISGANLGLQMAIPIDTAGDGSLELLLDGKLAATVPFQIKKRVASSS